jgi:RND family efflux transporter MFP subunit
VTAAEATHEQALRDEKRHDNLLKSNATSRQAFEKIATAARTSEAELHRAAEALNEVQATLEWATVRAPMDGTVIDKQVDVGDLVRPGQVLVTLFDPQRMQLVATVRESLTRRLEVGQSIGVEIEGINQQCTGIISEIVPEAQVASRAFEVKVTGPYPAGVYTGMFGRILIPLDAEPVLVLPRQAVRSVGQLELVDAVKEGRSSRRTVRTGRVFSDDVEVLSGLQEGEQVVIAAEIADSRESSHD